MDKNRKADWVKTDDDSVQYRREAVELEQGQEKVVELYQLQIVCDITKVSDPDPKIYAIAHDFVYLSEIDTESVLESYGYKDMEELKQTYGDDELDSGCLENLMHRTPLMTWEQGRKAIEAITGGIRR